MAGDVSPVAMFNFICLANLEKMHLCVFVGPLWSDLEEAKFLFLGPLGLTRDGKSVENSTEEYFSPK